MCASANTYCPIKISSVSPVRALAFYASFRLSCCSGLPESLLGAQVSMSLFLFVQWLISRMLKTTTVIHTVFMRGTGVANPASTDNRIIRLKLTISVSHGLQIWRFIAMSAYTL